VLSVTITSIRLISKSSIPNSWIRATNPSASAVMMLQAVMIAITKPSGRRARQIAASFLRRFFVLLKKLQLGTLMNFSSSRKLHTLLEGFEVES
jgi:flagellar motor protein MotB